MSADPTKAGSELPPDFRRRMVWQKVPVILIAVAVLVFAGAMVDKGFHARGEGFGGAKGIPLPPDPPTPKTVKLEPKTQKDLHALVMRFVQTAVARKNLAVSYRLIGPGLREGISRKRWMAGQVTVVPYPVDRKTSLLWKKPEYTYARSVRLQLEVVTPDMPNQTKLQAADTFFVDLIKRDGGWLVNNWVPRWTAMIPNSSG